MKKRILSILAGILMMAGAAFPQMAFAGRCANSKFFGMDAWYSLLECSNNGEIAQSNFQEGKLGSTIVNIVTVVVKDALFIAGFVAVGFVAYGGFLMVTSSGNPSAVEKAKKTITGAIIGLVISILAYAIVAFIVGRMGGTA